MLPYAVPGFPEQLMFFCAHQELVIVSHNYHEITVLFQFGDHRRPFQVILPDNRHIFVLGTSFNITTDEVSGNMKITMESGSIRFEDTDGRQYTLKPGEQLLQKKTKSIQIKQVSIAREIAWTKRLFWFEETPIKEVFGQLEDTYGVSIKVSNNVKDQLITAKLRQEPLDKVLRLLEESTGVHFKRTGNIVIAF